MIAVFALAVEAAVWRYEAADRSYASAANKLEDAIRADDREVGELMTQTASMLEESILATQQQKSAADQVGTAMAQIREAADQLAAEQAQRSATAERVEQLVGEFEQTLRRYGTRRSGRTR